MGLELGLLTENSLLPKIEVVKQILNGASAIVAFSGGVDSSTLAAIAKESCTDVLLVMQTGYTVASGEKEIAQNVAKFLDLPILFLEYNEFDESPEYASNPENRCYFCKSLLHEKLEQIRKERGYDFVLNGTNISDLAGHRPGYQAIKEFHALSPFVDAKLTKMEIRAIAHRYGLPVWNKPATPCLASRIQTGIQITPEILQMVDKAEQYLRSNFDFPILRVRYLRGNTASIEVEPEKIGIVRIAYKQISSTLQKIGFNNVVIDPEGYRSYVPKDRLKKSLT